MKDCTPQRIAGGTKNRGCKSKPSLLYGIKQHNVTMTEVFVLFVLFGVWGLVAFSQNIDQTETGSCAKFREFLIQTQFRVFGLFQRQYFVLLKRLQL